MDATKLFAAATCDRYSYNTKYEGGRDEDAIKFLLGFSKLMPNQLIIDLKQCLVKLTPQEIVDKLQSQERVVSLGGWFGRPSHSIIYEADPKSGTFSMYNSGDGLEYHVLKRIDHMFKNYPKYTLRNIPLKQLAHLRFWEYLKDMYEKKPEFSQEYWTGSSLYEYVKGKLAAGVLVDYSSNDDAEFSAAMDSGSCWFKTALRFCKLNMPNRDYQILKQQFKMTLLSQDYHDVLLFHRGVQSHARSLAKYLNRGIIHDVVYTCEVKKLRGLRDEILIFETKRAKTLNELSWKYHWDIQNVIPNLNESCPLIEKPVHQNSNFDCIGGEIPLDNAVNHCRLLKKYGRTLELYHFCREAIRSLPLQSSGAKIQSETLLALLGILNSTSSESPEPTDFILRLKLFYSYILAVNTIWKEKYSIDLLKYKLFPPEIMLLPHHFISDSRDLMTLNDIYGLYQPVSECESILQFNIGTIGNKKSILILIPSYPLKKKETFPLVTWIGRLFPNLSEEKIWEIQTDPNMIFQKLFTEDGHPDFKELLNFAISTYSGSKTGKKNTIRFINDGLRPEGQYILCETHTKEVVSKHFMVEYKAAVEKRRIGSKLSDTLRTIRIFDILKYWEEHPDLLNTEAEYKSLERNLFYRVGLPPRFKLDDKESEHLKIKLCKLIEQTLIDAKNSGNLHLLSRGFNIIYFTHKFAPENVKARLLSQNKIIELILHAKTIPKGFWLSLINLYQKRDDAYVLFAHVCTALDIEKAEEHYQIRLINGEPKKVIPAETLETLIKILKKHNLIEKSLKILKYNPLIGCIEFYEDKYLYLTTGVFYSGKIPQRTLLSPDKKELISDDELKEKLQTPIIKGNYQRINNKSANLVPIFKARNYEAWQNVDQPFIYILDVDTNCRFYVNGLTSICKDLKNNLILMTQYNKKISHLDHLMENLEHKEFIHLWGYTQAGRVERVEFPRLRISFKIWGTELQNEQYPGYFYTAYSVDIPAYFAGIGILLTNLKKNEIFILREDNLETSKNFLFPKIAPGNDPNTRPRTFVLVRKSSNDLFEGSRTGMLFLVYIFLRARQYRQAIKYFTIIPKYYGPNKAEKTMITRIIDIIIYNKEPDLYAFLMQFIYLCKQSPLFYTMGKNVEAIYSHYIKRFTNTTGALRLSLSSDYIPHAFHQENLTWYCKPTYKNLIGTSISNYKDIKYPELSSSFDPEKPLATTPMHFFTNSWLDHVYFFICFYLKNDGPSIEALHDKMLESSCLTQAEEKSCLKDFLKIMTIPLKELGILFTSEQKIAFQQISKNDLRIATFTLHQMLEATIFSVHPIHDVQRKMISPEENPTGYAVTLGKSHGRMDDYVRIECFLKGAQPLQPMQIERTINIPTHFTKASTFIFDGKLDFPIGKQLINNLMEGCARARMAPSLPHRLISTSKSRATVQFHVERYLNEWNHLSSIGKIHYERLLVSEERDQLDISTAFGWLVINNDFTPQAKALKNALLNYIGDTSLDPRIAYFEYKTGITLHPNQIELIPVIESKKNLVLCLPCGAGKTNILTYLINEISDKVIINVVPQEHFETHINIVNRHSWKLTGHPVDVLKFSVSGSYKKIIDQIIYCQKHRVIMITTPYDLQSLVLRYLSALNKNSSEAAELIEIFKMFKSKCLMLGDEIHEILKALWELNYGTNEQVTMPEERYVIPLMIYALKKTNGDYITKLAQRIVSADEVNTCVQYLNAISEKISDKDRDRLHQWWITQNRNTKVQLQIARAQITKYIPFSTGLRCFVDYGPTSKSSIAIPYKANNIPSESSSYSFYETKINLTIQMYFEIGLKDEQVLQLLTNLRLQNYAEQRVSKETQAQQFFDSLTKRINAPPLSLNHLPINNPDEMAFYLHSLKHDDKAIVYMLRNYILPSITVDATKYHSTGYDLLNIFDNWIGMSATISNSVHYPNDIHYFFDKSPKSDYLRNIINSDFTKVLCVEKIELKKIVSKKGVCCILDPGAFFRGINNRDVALEMLSYAPININVAAYFDLKSNQLMVINRTGESTLYLENTDPINTILWYNDQSHCIGHHSEKPQNGIGIVLITTKMPFTTLYQACERMRGWGDTQEIILVITREIADEIGSRELSNICLWALGHEGKELEKVIPSIFQELMLQECRKSLIENCTKTLQKENFDIVFERLKHDQYVNDSSLEKPISAKQLLNLSALHFKEKYKPLLGNEGCLKIEALLKKACDLLPDDVLVSSCHNFSQTSEQQVACESHEQVIDPHRIFQPTYLDAESIILSEAMQSISNSLHIIIKDVYAGSQLRRVFPLDGFSPTIYFTSNFLASKGNVPEYGSPDFVILCRFFPRIKYVLRVMKKYLVVDDHEADTFAEYILKNKNVMDISLYHINGEVVVGRPQYVVENESTFSQLKFLNCSNSGFSPDTVEKKKLFDLLYHLRRDGVTANQVYKTNMDQMDIMDIMDA